jgi:hypothetical protein
MWSSSITNSIYAFDCLMKYDQADYVQIISIMIMQVYTYTHTDAYMYICMIVNMRKLIVCVQIHS